MKVKPLGENVLIKVVEEAEAKYGNIVIPETAAERPQEGVVKAVGAGRLNKQGRRVPLGVKPGDRVIYHSYAGTEVTIDGEKYLVMRESDILAVM